MDDKNRRYKLEEAKSILIDAKRRFELGHFTMALYEGSIAQGAFESRYNQKGVDDSKDLIRKSRLGIIGRYSQDIVDQITKRISTIENAELRRLTALASREILNEELRKVLPGKVEYNELSDHVRARLNYPTRQEDVVKTEVFDLLGISDAA